MSLRPRKNIKLPSLEKFPSDAVVIDRIHEEGDVILGWQGTVMHPDGTMRLAITHNKIGKPHVTLKLGPPGDFRSQAQRLEHSILGKGPKFAQMSITHDNERGVFSIRKNTADKVGRAITVTPANPKAAYLASAMKKIIPRLRLDSRCSEQDNARWAAVLRQLGEIYCG